MAGFPPGAREPLWRSRGRSVLRLPPPVNAASSTPALLLPIAVSVGVPLVFLYAVRRLDLYASGGFGLVVGCFVSGLLAFVLAYFVNTGALRGLVGLGLTAAAALLALRTVVAPIVEEVAKSVGLVGAVRRPDFTYFVDGAIYGFAAGTAFAIVENVYYLSRAGAGETLGLSVNRAFSTSLMHGTASALVGVALGRYRYRRGNHRALALAFGWAAAISLHMSFNRLVNRGPLTSLDIAAAMLIGFAGVGLVAGFILWGLREEQRWLRESLGAAVGVTAGESAMVQQLRDLQTLLEPVELHFGPAKRRDAEAFLRLQARLGLKVKGAEMAEDPAQRAALLAQVADMRAQMDVLRRRVGVYCMSFIRSILPPEGEPIWDRLSLAVAEAPAPQSDLWRTLGARASADTEAPAAPQPTGEV
jgi:RsiW-degrading membrane proteinase PrsW (M82 family)